MTKPIYQFQRNKLTTSTDKYYSLDSEDKNPKNKLSDDISQHYIFNI